MAWSLDETPEDASGSAQRAEDRNDAKLRRTIGQHQKKPARKSAPGVQPFRTPGSVPIAFHQGSKNQSAPTSMANRALRNPRPAGVIQTGVFSSVKSHQPNHRMKSGMFRKVVPPTLITLLIKVAR